MNATPRSVSVSVTRDCEGRYHLRVIGRRGEVIAASLAEAMAAAMEHRLACGGTERSGEFLACGGVDKPVA